MTQAVAALQHFTAYRIYVIIVYPIPFLLEKNREIGEVVMMMMKSFNRKMALGILHFALQ